MTPKPQHGGSRPVSRPDDGRLRTKVNEPVRITVLLERRHLDWLKENFQSVSEGIRALIQERNIEMYNVLLINYAGDPTETEIDAERFADAAKEFRIDCEVKETETGHGVFVLTEADKKRFFRLNEKFTENTLGPVGW